MFLIKKFLNDFFFCFKTLILLTIQFSSLWFVFVTRINIENFFLKKLKNETFFQHIL